MIRPRHRIAFDYIAVPIDIWIEELRARFSDVAAKRPEFSDIHVAIDVPGAVALTGTAPSESTRRLAELLVSLEPGVRSIRNDVVVRPEQVEAASNKSQHIE